MEVKSQTIEQRWSKSRSGAWSARGFHFQYLVATLVMVKQWAGEIPPGRLVPEGLEDCHIEMAKSTVYLQVKSKFDDAFSETKVASVMKEVVEKSKTISGDLPQRRALCLEQPVKGQAITPFEDFTGDDDKAIYICSDPITDIIDALIAHSDCVNQVAYALAGHLYARVATASASNASLAYKERISFTVAETGTLIQDFLMATGGSYLDEALSSGVVQHLDLQTQLPDPGFYLGVKAKPGHIAAGLILDRPELVSAIGHDFLSGRAVMIEGQSGAGKSALMWLLAKSLQTKMRWFKISSQATLADAPKIVACLRARRPSERSPVAIAMDGVGPANADLWAHICDVIGDIPHAHIVGTVRIEDKALIRDTAEISFHRASMDETFAEEVWARLKAQHLTTWAHWKEPFEQSEGLLLEYVHILTQGKRLEEVIADQIAIRQTENRVDELNILRATSALSALGAEIDAQQLFQNLGIESIAAFQALRRLMDEHLVRESRPGVLGGLHKLRSAAIANATHDEIAFQRSQSVLASMAAVTIESLPDFILQCFRKEQPKEDVLLAHFAGILSKTTSLQTWVAILTGLGLVSLDQYATTVLASFDKYDVQRAQRLLAALFVVVGTDTSFFETLKHMDGFRAAIDEISTLDVRDLRKECLALIDGEVKSPDCLNFEDAVDFLRSVTPLPNGPKIDIDFRVGIEGEGVPDIVETATLMSAAYALSPKIAKDIAEGLGGEERLLAEFARQTPWVSEVHISEDDQGKCIL